MSDPRRPTVAIATCAEFPDLFGEEQAIPRLLHARGVEAQPVVWDDPAVRWEDYSAVVLRSMWDYFKKIEAFRSWLDETERRRVRLFNSQALVRWNLDKRYLRELEGRGVPIVPTLFIEPRSPASLGEILAERGWQRAILKPAVSGNAYRTHAIDAAGAEAHQAELDGILTSTAALVQPFAPEIVDEGEWSMLFFGASFSHAVLKVPAAGDFRVQTQFGGTSRRIDPPAALRKQAERVLASLPVAPLYARVDGIRRGADLLLMEVEVIEPYLYLTGLPDQLENYVSAVARAVLAA